MLLYTPQILALLLGLALGSFANVLIARVPAGQSILSPPSSCPGCRARIRPWDNIPLLSWILLRARCRSCGMRISLRYPLVELLVAALFVALSLAWPLQPAFFHFAAPALLLWRRTRAVASSGNVRCSRRSRNSSCCSAISSSDWLACWRSSCSRASES